jgi:hypothetical protein
MLRYDLFIDESGRFDETQAGSDEKRASQLAGILAPEGRFTVAKAEALLGEAHRAAGLELGHEVHGTEIKRGPLQPLITTLAEAVAADVDLTPVRIVNTERVDFGGKVPTYTNMLAELVVRLFEQLDHPGSGELVINIIYALWSPDRMQVGRPEYLTRLEERLVWALVQRGRAGQSGRWKVGKVRYDSGKTHRCLQVCDLLSNASFGDCSRCGPSARQAVKMAFGASDFSWTVHALSQQVTELANQGSLGPAIQTLSSALCEPDLAPDARSNMRARLQQVVGTLGRIDSAARHTQLAIVLGWLQQLVDHRADLQRGADLCAFIIEYVEPALRAAAGDGDLSTEAFAFSLQRLRLTAANHLGDLRTARDAFMQLDDRMPRLAGRWEHAQTLIEALVHESVHLTDSLDFDGASGRMRAVSGYYGDLGALFNVALPSVFPETLRSDVRGQALGTWVQAEMYAGLRDPARLEIARDLSDKALAEFSTASDTLRQQQYRAQLETYAGHFEDARRWLARSLGIDDTSHEAIATSVSSCEGHAEGFALLHWTRIGAFAGLVGASAELGLFMSAMRRARIHASPWVTDPHKEYPAHGVRRMLTIALAAHGAVDEALSVIGQLRALEPDPTRHPAMVLTVAAAHAQLAAFCCQGHPDRASDLIRGKRDRIGARQLVEGIKKVTPPAVSTLHHALDTWLELFADFDATSSAVALRRAALAIPD